MGGILFPKRCEAPHDERNEAGVVSWHSGYEWRVCPVCKEVFTVAKKADGTKCGKVKCNE